MASPFQQAAARVSGSPFGFSGLPQPPTIQSLLEQAYPGMSLSTVTSSLSDFTPDRLQRLSQATGYLENIDPQFAQQRFFQDPQNQYQHALTMWRTFNQNLSQNWWDANFRSRLQEAGLQTPYMPFSDFLNVQGYSQDLLNALGAWFQGGRVPVSPNLNADAIRRALGYSPVYRGPQELPADIQTSNPEATRAIFEFAQAEGGAQAALNTFRSLSAQGRQSVGNALGLPPEAVEAQLQALIARGI